MDLSIPFCRKKLLHNHKAVLSGLFKPRKTVSQVSVGLNRRIPLHLPVSKQKQQGNLGGLTNRNKICLSLSVNAYAAACSCHGKTNRSPFSSLEEKSRTFTPKLLPFLTESNHLNGKAATLSRKNLCFSDHVLSRRPCVFAGSSSSTTSFDSTYLLSRSLHSSHGSALGGNQRRAEKLGRHGKTETLLSCSLDPYRKSPPSFSKDAIQASCTPWSSLLSVFYPRLLVSSSLSPCLVHRQLAEKRRKAREHPGERRSFTTSSRMEHSRPSKDKDVQTGQQLQEKQFSPGLEGVIAGESSISTVNENSGGRTT